MPDQRRVTRTDDPDERRSTALLGLATGSEGLIEAQESRGQRELLASEQLPAKSPIAELEALGFTFGSVDDRDPLFRPATLPAGWRREGSDHAMWSYIVDDRGRRRVAVFYKAAFYDRRAHTRLVHPTERLSEAIYADGEPDAIVLDELLTAEVARAYLDEQLASTRKYLASWGAGDDTAEAEAARIEAMLRLLPDESAELSLNPTQGGLSHA